MNDEHEQSPDKGFFRGMIGMIALVGAMVGFFLLFYVEMPARNENALLLALGVVLGWGGSVVSSEYGATTTGRKVAESVVRDIERRNIAADAAPSGTPEDPLSVAGATDAPPVDVKEKKE